MISEKVQTRRQRVVELICLGFSTRQIALELQANRHTIIFDVKVLCAEYGADNQKQLSSMATARGLLKRGIDNPREVGDTRVQ